MRKEELRKDPIRENIVKMIDYLTVNRSLIVKIFSGIVLIVAFASYYTHVVKIKSQNASNITGLAMNGFVNGDFDESLIKFERVLNDFPNSLGASQALVFVLNDAISREDFKTAKELLANYNRTISNIKDSVVRSRIYKIQGDLSLQGGDYENALAFYQKAANLSEDGNIQLQYMLDMISVLLITGDYSKAFSELNGIMENINLGFNEKNKAEEYLAFVNQKLGT